MAEGRSNEVFGEVVQQSFVELRRLLFEGEYRLRKANLV